MDILPGLFCEDEVVARFKSSGLNLRTLRRCARAKGVGRKFSRHWFFTEPEILELMGQRRHAQTRKTAGLVKLLRARGIPRRARFRKPWNSRPSGSRKASRHAAKRHLRKAGAWWRSARRRVRRRSLAIHGRGGAPVCRPVASPFRRHAYRPDRSASYRLRCGGDLSGLFPGTRNRKVHTPTSAILKFAGVTRNIRRPKAPPGIVRWLAQDEARRLIAACSPHLRPLVMFLLHTEPASGRRCGSIGALLISPARMSPSR